MRAALVDHRHGRRGGLYGRELWAFRRLRLDRGDRQRHPDPVGHVDDGATLTLPGIAGIVLTVGTAVDANVIIYERIREELRAGKRIVKAIDDGFGEAMSAIIDATSPASSRLR